MAFATQSTAGGRSGERPALAGLLKLWKGSLLESLLVVRLVLK